MAGISLVGALAALAPSGDARDRLSRGESLMVGAGVLALGGALWVAAYLVLSLLGPVLLAALAGFGPSGVLGTLALTPIGVRAYRQERARRHRGDRAAAPAPPRR